MLRIGIADDEPPARARLRSLLESVDEVEIVGEARNGPEAVDLIRERRPEVLFLDVQMPGMTGFEVIDAIGASNMPVTVFVTAYDEFALKAFEANALDYLLKPFEEERFFSTLERARVRLRGERTREAERALESLLASLSPLHRAPERLVARVGSRIRFVDLDEVDWIEAEGNYVRVHAGKTSHLIRDSISGLDSRLDPRRFVRIHRSAIVNLASVQELESVFQGEYAVVLRGGKKLTSSRSYRERLERALGIG